MRDAVTAPQCFRGRDRGGTQLSHLQGVGVPRSCMSASPLRLFALAVSGVVLAVGCVEEVTHPFPPDPETGGTGNAHPPVGGSSAGAGAPSGGSANAGGTGGTAPANGGKPPGSQAESGGNSGSAATGGKSAAGGAALGGKAGASTGGAAPSPSDAGAAGETMLGEGGAPALPSDEIPDGYVKGIIAVGYGGLRVVSRDDGKTWSDAVDLGDENADDENLLRAVTYGKGRWIATGWKLLFSDDGVNWTQHSMVRDEFQNQQIIEGLAYKDGYFYGAGDPGRFYRSADGVDWEPYGEPIGDTEKHTALSFRAGKFVSYGDSNASFESRDGMTWTEMDIEQGTYCEGQWRSLSQCHDAAWFDGGFYLRVEWGGEILRSESGSNFQRVYKDPDEHTAYKTITFAEGYVAP